MDLDIHSEIANLLGWFATIALVLLGFAIAFEMIMWRRLFKLVNSMKSSGSNFRPVMNGERATSLMKVKELGAHVELFPSGTKVHGCLLCGNTKLRRPRAGDEDNPLSMLCPNCMHQFSFEGEKMIINPVTTELAKDVYGI